MGGISIRAAGEEDIAALIEYVTALRAERLASIFRFDTVPTFDEERQFLRQFERPGSRFFIAIDKDKVVGNVGIRAGLHPQTSHVGTLGIAVLAPYRNRGIGSRLLDTADAWARHSGLRRLELEVLSNNPVAQRLYLRKGYAVEGCRHAAVAVDGDFVDSIIMGRAAGPAA